MSTVRTPELALAVDALQAVISDAHKGVADVPQGRLIVASTNGMCRVIKTDLDRRISAAKLAALEAKVVGGDRQIEPPKEAAGR